MCLKVFLNKKLKLTLLNFTPITNPDITKGHINFLE